MPVLLAGPNGAGKSILHETRVAQSFADAFINADVIQRGELRDPSMEPADKAARMAEAQRNRQLDAGKCCAPETVFSHPSKLEIIETAQSRGDLIDATHVGVGGAELSVARIRRRRDEGGHDLPEGNFRAPQAVGVALATWG